jgi:hypothetical protein
MTAGATTSRSRPREVAAASPGSIAGRRQIGAGLARCGWLVEIVLISERESDSRFFAVGVLDGYDAEEAILRYPGIIREDMRKARRRLSDAEIASLELREGGMRPYRLRSGSRPDY